MVLRDNNNNRENEVNDYQNDSYDNTVDNSDIKVSDGGVKVFSKNNIKTAFVTNKSFLIKSGILVLVLLIILAIVALITNNR